MWWVQVGRFQGLVPTSLSTGRVRPIPPGHSVLMSRSSFLVGVTKLWGALTCSCSHYSRICWDAWLGLAWKMNALKYIVKTGRSLLFLRPGDYFVAFTQCPFVLWLVEKQTIHLADFDMLVEDMQNYRSQIESLLASTAPCQEFQSVIAKVQSSLVTFLLIYKTGVSI